MQYPVWIYRLRCWVTRLVLGFQISYDLWLIHLGSSAGKSAAKGKCSTGQWILYSLVASNYFCYLWFPIFQSLLYTNHNEWFSGQVFYSESIFGNGKFFLSFCSPVHIWTCDSWNTNSGSSLPTAMRIFFFNRVSLAS